jgi:two-component system sensor histidine kinase/response regulator
MKHINSTVQVSAPDPSEESMAPMPLPTHGYLGLRAKLVLFFSLILIIACSTLSWYYIMERREAMTKNLQQLGTILLTSVVNNAGFRYAGLVAEDRITLQQFIDSLLAVQEVVYVVITRPDGTVLAQYTKGARQSSSSLMRSIGHPLYPDSQIAKQLFTLSSTAPQITPLPISNTLKDRFAWKEQVYDFAMSVLRTESGSSPLPSIFLQLEEGRADSSRTQQSLVSGVVQIGLTNAHLEYELAEMIRNIFIFTAFIIGASAFGAYMLSLRITKPLISLAVVAQQVTEGRSLMPLIPSTNDEIGQLTSTFNLMTESLAERNLAITMNMATIEHQVGQLTTLHQVSTAIAQTLDLNQILNTVQHLLIANWGFMRMFVMLRRRERNTAYVAKIAGVSPDIAEAARNYEIPIQDDGSLRADLLIHGKPLLIQNVEAVADRLHPPILELARHAEVTSFVAVPLQSQNQIIGYLAADRGAQPCTDEDLHMMMTIAGHVAAAIELTAANERLQEQDRRRSLFLSVASHELRTPMTVIRSFADNMRDGIAGPVSEQQMTYLTRIGHNLNRLTRIINQLLDWGRLDSKNDPLRLTPVCIEATALLVTDSLRNVATEKMVTLEIVHANALPAIQGDGDKLEQILWNLIGNAIKFTSAGGRVTVEFKTTPEGFVQTCVADTGCGIDPGQLGKLFQEFSKVPSAVPTAQGAQLGLFITKSLVTMHRGTIWVESTPGAGTRFYFTVPVCSQVDRLKAERKE